MQPSFETLNSRSGANSLIKQCTRLSYPVLAINSAVKPFQSFGDAIDVVLTHVGNLLELNIPISLSVFSIAGPTPFIFLRLSRRV